jgi:hypothetical protein
MRLFGDARHHKREPVTTYPQVQLFFRRRHNARIGLMPAVATCAFVLLVAFLILTRDVDPNATGQGRSLFISAAIGTLAGVAVLVRYLRAAVSQRGSVVRVRNPFCSYEVELESCRGFFEVERLGKAYLALARKERRSVRVVAMPFLECLERLDLADLPYLDHLRGRR